MSNLYRTQSTSTRPSSSGVLVFAYGSNMCLERIRERVSSAKLLATGYVSERRLAFHKRSVDGSAKADAYYTGLARDRVWGVVFEVQLEQKLLLDEYEFLGIGYDQQELEVTTELQRVKAWTYIARPEAIDTRLLPYCWYHTLVVHGANQLRLPQTYIDVLQKKPFRPDDDAARIARHRRLILPDNAVTASYSTAAAE